MQFPLALPRLTESDLQMRGILRSWSKPVEVGCILWEMVVEAAARVGHEIPYFIIGDMSEDLHENPWIYKNILSIYKTILTTTCS